MTQIEEKAQAYAERIKGGLSVQDAKWAVRRAYLQGTKDILSLPLSERLTEEEKKKIKQEWSVAHSRGWYHRPYLRGRFRVLQDIFGSDFFQGRRQ